MKRLFMLAVLVAVAFQSNVWAEVERSPEDVFHTYFEASDKCDFASIVGEMHPRTLHFFKKGTLNIVDASTSKFSKEAVTTAFPGVSDLAEMKDYREDDFWVYVMTTVYSHARGSNREDKPKIIGKVEDGDYVHILYRRHGDLKITSEVENYVAPRCFTLRKHEGHWRCYSFAIDAVENHVVGCATAAHKMEEGPASEPAIPGQTPALPEASE
jgi:hypothetical protein